MQTTLMEATPDTSTTPPVADSKRFTVKVSTSDNLYYLATTQDSLYWDVPTTDKLQKMMNNSSKRFFHAEIRSGRLVLVKFAPWQDW